MSYLSTISLILISTAALASDPSSLCLRDANDQVSFSGKPLQRHDSSISVITWNAQKYSDDRFLSDLQRVSETADIVLVQEALHSTQHQNEFSWNFPFHFSFHKSFCMPNNHATGVINSARFELFNNLTFPSPDQELLIFTPKVSAYSQVVVNGKLIHLINTHALNFNLGGPFERQIYQIAKFISKLSGPVVWAGDFNTWNLPRKNYLTNITKALGMKHLSPGKDPRRLILDHVFVRGLVASKTEVLLEKSSDHYPLRTILHFE